MQHHDASALETLRRLPPGSDIDAELEEKAPARSQLVDIPMDDGDDADATQVDVERTCFGDEIDSLQPARASWARAAPTVVQLPRAQHMHRSNESHTAQLLPAPLVCTLDGESIDADVFNALPIELQREVLAERAVQMALDAERVSHNGSSRNASSESLRSHGDGNGSSADPIDDGSCWTCCVCTFANHPELVECEICETLRPQLDDLAFGNDDGYDRMYSASRVTPLPSHLAHETRNRTGSKSTELYSKLSQRLGSTMVSRSLKKIRLPATPAATKLTMNDEPTADDLRVVATARVQQLQTSASQTLRHAKQTLIARAHSSQKPRSSSSSDALQLPTAAAVAELCALQNELNRKCEPGDELYEQLLERLWAAIYQDAPTSDTAATTAPTLRRRTFERVSDGWVAIGFQGPNPDTDFRGGGVLALKCLVYAFEAFPQRMLAVVAAQQPVAGTRWYPACVAGVNVTCLLAGALQLGTGAFATTPTTYWRLFEDPSAFYQLFVYTFIKMDATWRRMNASYMDFGVVLKATRRIVDAMLAVGPETLTELRDAADRTFLDQFVGRITRQSLADSENGECPDPYNALEDDSDAALVPSRSARALRLAADAPLR